MPHHSLLNTYLLSTCYVLSKVLGAETPQSKRHEVPAFRSYNLVEDLNS